MKNKMLAILCAGLLGLGAVACNGGTDDTTTDPAATAPADLTS